MLHLFEMTSVTESLCTSTSSSLVSCDILQLDKEERHQHRAEESNAVLS